LNYGERRQYSDGVRRIPGSPACCTLRLEFPRRPDGSSRPRVAILLIALGVRATCRPVLQPMSVQHGWTREVFSLAFAIQSIVGGSDACIPRRRGSLRAAARSCSVRCSTRPALPAWRTRSLRRPVLTGGVLCGLGQSATTFGVVLGVVARNYTVQKRSTRSASQVRAARWGSS